jgi:N-acetylglucosaminyldiphosphoundecaprenol N-acetyl-beta-D-mannosaminyltransferase
VKHIFYNIRIDITTQEEILKRCRKILHSNQTRTLYFLNAHCFNVAQQDPDYYDTLQRADILLNDGIGLKLASYLKRVRFKENLNGTDLIPKIIALAASEGKKVFFFGAREGIAASAANKAMLMNPALKVAGVLSGYFTKEEEPEIIRQIKSTAADVLILGMGVPLQEKWADKNRHLLPEVKLIIAGGAILDFMSGNVARAPRWMQQSGTEWIYRLVQEPGRMWRRYLIGNFTFFYHIFRLRAGAN